MAVTIYNIWHIMAVTTLIHYIISHSHTVTVRVGLKKKKKSPREKLKEVRPDLLSTPREREIRKDKAWRRRLRSSLISSI